MLVVVDRQSSPTLDDLHKQAVVMKQFPDRTYTFVGCTAETIDFVGGQGQNRSGAPSLAAVSVPTRGFSVLETLFQTRRFDNFAG